MEHQERDRAVIRFSIVDTGIGIEPENLDHVFSSFTQADNSTTRQYGGTGLGTTISKQLVELMGGRISVDSQPGNGSTFRFTAAFGIQPDCRPQPAGETVRADRMTLLVVDNCATTCRILSAYLDQLGVSALTATDGNVALSLLAERADGGQPVDAIITDARMPGMNGVVLKDHIRQMPPYTRTPIIVATSLKQMVAGRDYVSLGFDGSFSKPVKLEDLKAVLDRVRAGGPADTSTARIESKQAGADRQGDRPRERRGHILVADDYLTNQQVAFMHLTAAGFSVDLAENGRQAVEAFNRARYDLILMDIQMPVLNGFDATGEIRALEAEQRHRRRTPSSP